MKMFTLFWQGGKAELIFGNDRHDAMSRYGSKALKSAMIASGDQIEKWRYQNGTWLRKCL